MDGDKLNNCIVELQGISKLLMTLTDDEDRPTLEKAAMAAALSSIGLHISRITADLEQMA